MVELNHKVRKVGHHRAPEAAWTRGEVDELFVLGPLRFGGEDGFLARCSFRREKLAKKDTERFYLEILWNILEVFPGQRNALDVRMFLPLDVEHGFIKDNTFVLFREHAHEAFHEVL
jgi:hypothetical protein